MASWDDAEVNADSAELMDWLWDIPDRPDPVNSDLAGIGGADLIPLTKPLRWPDADDRIPPPPPPLPVDDRPTLAVPPTEALDLGTTTNASEERVGDHLASYDYEAALAPIFAGQQTRARFSGRRAAAVTAIVVLVATGVGVGYKLFAGSGTSKPSNSTFGSPTTAVQTSLASGAVPLFGDTTTSSTSTTSTTAPTTTTTSSSVPAVATATTTTTSTSVKRTTTTTTGTTTPPRATTTTSPTVVATVPHGTTTVPGTTTSVVPATTSTTNLLPPIISIPIGP